MADSSSGDGADELLHEACKAGDVEKLREAIAAGADVDAKLPLKQTVQKQTPLCCAVSARR